VNTWSPLTIEAGKIVVYGKGGEHHLHAVRRPAKNHPGAPMLFSSRGRGSFLGIKVFIPPKANGWLFSGLERASDSTSKDHDEEAAVFNLKKKPDAPGIGTGSGEAARRRE